VQPPTVGTVAEEDTPRPPPPQGHPGGPALERGATRRWRRQTGQATHPEQGRTLALPGTRAEAPTPDLEPELTTERPAHVPAPMAIPPRAVESGRRQRPRRPQRERGPDLER